LSSDLDVVTNLKNIRSQFLDILTLVLTHPVPDTNLSTYCLPCEN